MDTFYFFVLNSALGSIKIIQVTTAKTNLNNYKDPGFYYFSGSYTPTNIPAGTNGWLIVFPNQDESAVKQLWLRHGTPGSNDFETHVRTYAGGSWGSWERYLTENDLNGIPLIQYGRVDIATTGTANDIASKAIKFPKAYKSAPIVMVTPATTSPGYQVLGCAAADITATGCNIYLNRSSKNTTTVMWVAFGAR